MYKPQRIFVSEVVVDHTDDGRGSVWSKHFLARETALRDVFGREDPSGSVWPGAMPLIARCPGASILRFVPCEDRQAWHCVSNGLAQPGNQMKDSAQYNGECGYGREFVLSSETAGNWQVRWLLTAMQWVALNDRRILPYESIATGRPIVPNGNPDLLHFITLTDMAYPAKLILPGGNCDLIHLLGVTKGECDFALRHCQIRAQGIRALASFFVTDDPYGPITDGQRPCLTRDPDFPEMWRSALSQIELTW